MMIDPSAFSFNPSALHLDERTDFIMRLPAGLTGKPALLEAFAAGLNFPAYFGQNWDALSDCLGDLSWLAQRRVVILHSDLPELPMIDLMVYFDILEDCIRDWKADEDHELSVAFPADAYVRIENLLGRNKIIA